MKGIISFTFSLLICLFFLSLYQKSVEADPYFLYDRGTGVYCYFYIFNSGGLILYVDCYLDDGYYLYGSSVYSYWNYNGYEYYLTSQPYYPLQGSLRFTLSADPHDSEYSLYNIFNVSGNLLNTLDNSHAAVDMTVSLDCYVCYSNLN